MLRPIRHLAAVVEVSAFDVLVLLLNVGLLNSLLNFDSSEADYQTLPHCHHSLSPLLAELWLNSQCCSSLDADKNH